ncbi:MAG: hypothetical protein WAO09_03665 [Candidatus Dormiibacterota bacterium]
MVRLCVGVYNQGVRGSRIVQAPDTVASLRRADSAALGVERLSTLTPIIKSRRPSHVQLD